MQIDQQKALDVTRAVVRCLRDDSGDEGRDRRAVGSALDWATVRPPLVELDEGQCAALDAALAAVNFRMPNAASLA